MTLFTLAHLADFSLSEINQNICPSEALSSLLTLRELFNSQISNVLFSCQNLKCYMFECKKNKNKKTVKRQYKINHHMKKLGRIKKKI